MKSVVVHSSLHTVRTTKPGEGVMNSHGVLYSARQMNLGLWGNEPHNPDPWASLAHRGVVQLHVEPLSSKEIAE